MAGVANDNVMSKHSGGFVEFLKNDSQLEIVTHFEVSPINIATTLTFSIGIWQILCGIFRLQFLMTYFSDPLVSGFTTGAAVHVFLAQVDDIMGVNVPKASGAGYIFKRLYDLATQVPHVNLTALVISLASISFLYIGKEYLSPSLAKKYKLRVPIPFELILIAITAALSSLFHWHEKSSLQIVGTIPAGLPHPDLPTFSILKECMVQSIAISIVIIAVHISMSKMLGKKLGYSIDDNQELYAIGLTSLLGGFFPVFPVSTALGRTMVNVKSGTRTQLSTVFSCALLLSIILWLGPLLKDLPKCVLASIITVALKSMFMKYGELRKIYPVSKIDFSIWIISFIFTVFIDVMEGLAIALIFALFTVIWRFQWLEYFLLPYDTQRGSKQKQIVRP
ncbi:inorganic anion transporter, SulP family [Dictyocaulus viviparus]|uniref:Inorganic anion transporter, SulP family n=1 Tax=Dictyocaulus viviparus TaxID=29172 RepID=A0A0D8Y9H5_DICVI|nr:inorganic anion transporter, SulP family [Dictyocaulus viviparus]